MILVSSFHTDIRINITSYIMINIDIDICSNINTEITTNNTLIKVAGSPGCLMMIPGRRGGSFCLQTCLVGPLRHRLTLLRKSERQSLGLKGNILNPKPYRLGVSPESLSP